MFLMYGMSFCVQGLKYPISAVLHQNAMQYITVGNVEQVQSAPSLPIYFDPELKQFGPAKFVTVDGVPYYLPYGDIQIGQSVELRWATEEHVVYACRVLAPDEPIHNGTYPVSQPIQPYTNVEIGSVIAIVFALLFGLAAVSQYPLGKIMAPRFAKKDKEFREGIVPNRFGLLHVGLQLLLTCGIVSGLALRGFRGAMFIFLLGLVFIGGMVLKKQTTTVSLDGDTLVIMDCNIVHRFERNSVKKVEFVASRLPYNRCLMLTLKNGTTFSFEQENFYGLESMYAELSNTSQ